MNETKRSDCHRTVKLLEEIEFLKKKIANRDADIAMLEDALESAEMHQKLFLERIEKRYERNKAVKLSQNSKTSRCE